MQKTTKILVASHSHEITGGAEKSLLEIIKQLDGDSRFDVTVALPYKGSFQSALKDLGIRYKILTYGWGAAQGKYDEKKLREANTQALTRVFSYLSKSKTDIVLTNTSVVPWFAYCCKALGIPHAWFIRELIGTADDIEYYPSNGYVIKTIKESSLIFANSQTTKEYYETLMDRTDIHVIYPHLDTHNLPKSISTQPGEGDTLKIIVVGAVTGDKKQFEVLQAINLLHKDGYNLRVTILGKTASIQYRKTLDRFIIDNELADVVSFVEHTPNPYPIIAQHDFCAVPSANESFGRVAIEAMLLGRIVIGANAGGNSETITDNVNGILYKSGDPKDLAEKINDIWSDKQRMGILSKRARTDSYDKYVKRSDTDSINDTVFNYMSDQNTNITADWLSQLALNEANKVSALIRDVTDQMTIVHKRDLVINELNDEIVNLRSQKKNKKFWK